MAKLLKKSPGIAFASILGWVLPLLVFPYFHFHPGDTHGHNGELQPHGHAAHLHSHELETLAHAFNFHPPDSQQDKARHHSHSSAEHDSDVFEINLFKADIKTGKHFKFKKDAGRLPFVADFTPFSFHSTAFDTGHFQEFSPAQNPQERSPPLFLI